MSSGNSAIGWITVVAVVLSVFSYIVSLFATAAVVTTTNLGVQLQSLTQPMILWAFFLGAYVDANSSLVIVLSLIVFVICFAKAATANGGFLSGLRSLSSGAPPKTLPNWLTVMPLLASSLLLIELLLSFLQLLFGVPTGAPGNTDPTMLLPGLALAPIAEEIGFRITVLGLVVGILLAVKFGWDIAGGAKVTTKHELAMFFVAFVSPGYAKERVGLPSIRTKGWKGISTAEWIFLFITSIVFGTYHWPLGAGGGWGPGKFLTAALSGFALGIVYLAYGAWADIMLHWFFDLNLYVFSVYDAFNGAFGTFGDLVTLGALALGVWGIIVALYWLGNRKTSSVLDSTVRYAPTF